MNSITKFDTPWELNDYVRSLRDNNTLSGETTLETKELFDSTPLHYETNFIVSLEDLTDFKTFSMCKHISLEQKVEYRQSKRHRKYTSVSIYKIPRSIVIDGDCSDYRVCLDCLLEEFK